jgi:hypothetical protein
VIGKLLSGLLKLVLALIIFAITGRWPQFARLRQLLGREPSTQARTAPKPRVASTPRPPPRPPTRTWSVEQAKPVREGEAYDHEGEDYEHEGEAYDHEGEDYEHEGEAYDHEGEDVDAGGSGGERTYAHEEAYQRERVAARAPRLGSVRARFREQTRGVNHRASLKAAFRDRRTLRDAVVLSAVLAQRPPQRR